ncbi:MAG: hypothetical protein Q8L53_09640 [Aestuariivirga sp.]|nr:hypothetical protein [Aestuariivirga sp.]
MSMLIEILVHARPGLRRFAMFLALIVAQMGVLAGEATSAEVTVHKKGKKVEIAFVGEVVAGDFDRFSKAASKYQTAEITFSSHGGSLADGLRIAELISQKNFSTTVRSGNTCASACGIMWLGGKQRSIEGSAQVGFHSAFDPGHDEKPSPEANTYVGYILKKLGFSEMVAAYAIEAAPRRMRWLTPNDARFLGIDVTWVSPGGLASHSSTQISLVPIPPSPLLEAPPLLRNEVETALLKQRFMSLMKESYPATYKALVDEVALNQSSGRSWTLALFDAYISMKLPDQLDKKLLDAMTSVHIVEFVDLFAIEVIEAGSRKDKLFCKRILKDKTIFEKQLQEAISYGPESFRNDLVDFYGKALETALSGKALAPAKATKKQRRLADREAERIVKRFVANLSKAERKRFYKAKDIFETDFGCRVLVYMFRELERKPEILRTIFLDV